MFIINIWRILYNLNGFVKRKSANLFELFILFYLFRLLVTAVFWFHAPVVQLTKALIVHSTFAIITIGTLSTITQLTSSKVTGNQFTLKIWASPHYITELKFFVVFAVFVSALTLCFCGIEYALSTSLT